MLATRMRRATAVRWQAAILPALAVRWADDALPRNKLPPGQGYLAGLSWDAGDHFGPSLPISKRPAQRPSPTRTALVQPVIRRGCGAGWWAQCAKVCVGRNPAQNPMLVLSGAQNME